MKGQGQGPSLKDQDKDKDKDLSHKDQDKDKDFTYSHLLQVAAKPTIAIKQYLTTMMAAQQPVLHLGPPL